MSFNKEATKLLSLTEGARQGSVLLGMSGGIDSTAALYLMQQAGLEVAGLTLHLFEQGSPLKPKASKPDGLYEAEDFPDDEVVQKASKIAKTMGIKHYILNLETAFSNEVMMPFVMGYLSGETPNPCIFCNKAVKAGYFYEAALELGYDYFATGHYARVHKNNDTGLFEVRQAYDTKKDQSYVLWQMNQEILSHFQLPLGNLDKTQNKEILRDAGLSYFFPGNKESQDICFIPGKDYVAFIKERVSKLPPAGPVFNEKGEEIGRHEGLWRYTIGQRKGLGIASSERLFVKGFDFERNALILAANHSLFSEALALKELNFISGTFPEAPAFLNAKIRYHAKETKSALTYDLASKKGSLRFFEPVRAATPGQSVVFYEDGTLLGGAFIEKILES